MTFSKATTRLVVALALLGLSSVEGKPKGGALRGLQCDEEEMLRQKDDNKDNKDNKDKEAGAQGVFPDDDVVLDGVSTMVPTGEESMLVTEASTETAEETTGFGPPFQPSDPAIATLAPTEGSTEGATEGATEGEPEAPAAVGGPNAGGPNAGGPDAGGPDAGGPGGAGAGVVGEEPCADNASWMWQGNATITCDWVSKRPDPTWECYWNQAYQVNCEKTCNKC